MRCTSVICLGVLFFTANLASGDDAPDLEQVLRTEGPIGWAVWRERTAEFRMTVRTTGFALNKATDERIEAPVLVAEFSRSGGNVLGVVERDGARFRVFGRNDAYEFKLRGSPTGAWQLDYVSEDVAAAEPTGAVIDVTSTDIVEGIETRGIARVPYSLLIVPMEQLLSDERFVVESVQEGQAANLVDLSFTLDNDDDGQVVYFGFPRSMQGVVSFDRDDNWAIQRIDIEDENGKSFTYVVSYQEFEGRRFPSSLSDTTDSKERFSEDLTVVEELRFDPIPPERFLISEFGLPEPELTDERR